MKKYIKSLFPWRWIIVVGFILLYSLVIFCTLTHFLVTPVEPWKLYAGNVIFWIFIDWAFGLGKEGDLFENHHKLD
jgi:magnesium-transporting ATPase (P-type)